MKSRLIAIVIVAAVCVIVLMMVRNRSRSGPAGQRVNVTAAKRTSAPATSGPVSIPTQRQLATELIRQGVTPERAKLRIVNSFDNGPGPYHFVFQGGKPAAK